MAQQEKRVHTGVACAHHVTLVAVAHVERFIGFALELAEGVLKDS